MQGGGLAEDQAARGGRAGWVQAQPGEGEQGADRRPRFRPGQRRADTEMRAVRERQVAPGAGAEDVEPVRVAEHLRIPVGRGQRDAHPVPGPDPGLADHHVPGRVPVHQRRGRLQPQRLLDRGRHQARVDPHQFQLARIAEQVQDRVGDHAVGGVDAAEHDHRGVRDDLGRGQVAELGGVREHGPPARRDLLVLRRDPAGARWPLACGRSRPAVTRPAVTGPFVTGPFVTGPSAIRPFVTPPSAIRPSAIRPFVTRPFVTRAAVTPPSAIRPAVTGADGGAQVRGQLGERAGGVRGRPGGAGALVAGQAGDAAHDPVVGGQDRVRRQVPQAQRLGHHGDGQRAGNGAAQLGGSVQADRGYQARGLRLGELSEPGRGATTVKRAEERGPVPGVRRAVQGQHARPDHPCRGEPGIVDGEGPRIPHDRDRRRVAGDQPAAEGRHPRHRRTRPQAGQQRMRILL